MTLRVERHVAAVVERLRAVVSPDLTVDMGVAPSDPPPYLVVYPNAGDVNLARLCGDRSDLLLRFEVEAVGEGSEQALWALDEARVALVGHRLTVVGAVVAPIDQIDGSDLHRNQLTQPPVYTIDAEFRVFSQAVGA